MPVKKATRSTRSTRTTKASSKAASSDVILDENTDSPAGLDDVKLKTSKPAAAPKKVLGERNAPNSHESSPQKETASSQTAAKKATTQKATKSKRGKKNVVEEVKEDAPSSGSRATTPVPSSPTKKRLPEEQVQAFLQNYDLEAQARLARLRASLEISVQSSITRMRLAIERIPRAVRELTLAEFIDEYGANIHNFMGRAPVQHLEETQKEWDQIREERSPIKAKRGKKDEEATAKAARNSKAARTTNPTASTSTTRTTAATAASRKKTTRSTKVSSRSTSAAPTSPPPASSSKPAPSLSTFQPDLPKEALQTPKPRMARPGEVIQWLSINGSPICGIIGEDGVVRPVTFA